MTFTHSFTLAQSCQQGAQDQRGGRWKHKDQEFKASLSYVRPGFRKTLKQSMNLADLSSSTGIRSTHKLLLCAMGWLADNQRGHPEGWRRCSSQEHTRLFSRIEHPHDDLTTTRTRPRSIWPLACLASELICTSPHRHTTASYIYILLVTYI